MHAKVFGIGLSRTGTTSLTEALRTLGYRAVHCPLSLIALKDRGLELNKSVVDRFDALTDSPVARVYQQLDAEFPSSKFILTTRSIEGWLSSMRRMRNSFSFLKLLPKVRQLTFDLCGTTSLSDEDALRQCFIKHGRSVREYFGARLGRDLLVFDAGAGDGWDKLCNFLGRESPAIPYPHHNRGYTTTLFNMRDLIRHSWPLS